MPRSYLLEENFLKKAILLGIISLFLLLASGTLAAAPQTNTTDEWLFPSIGFGRGDWDASVGAFFWNDTFKVRNLQLRGDVDLAPGIRYHSLIRSNRERDTLTGFQPHFDEQYIEGYGFRKLKSGTLSVDLKIGTTRYLHFPYPDSIALFDQVPGIGDLREDGVQGPAAGYSGALMTVDYAHTSGFGLHSAAIDWGFGRSGSNSLLENYIFYRHDIGALHLETHVGGLAVRQEPLGRRAAGFNVFFGANAGKYSCGLLYEKLHGQPAYTGVLVTFPLNPVTKALGRVAFDYDRNPEGFAMQIPLAKGTIGGISHTVPAGAGLVGEVTAERVRTYWQNGQVRNYYEHRRAAWGETSGKDLIVVLKEQPWYLQGEALVSPHSFSAGLKTWEKDRQGPAQLSQTVVYQFYRK